MTSNTSANSANSPAKSMGSADAPPQTFEIATGANQRQEYVLERNGPLVAAEMRQMALDCVSRRFVVVALAYRREQSRAFVCRTLKQAYRTLASVVGGKRRARGEFAACVVTPELSCMNYVEVRQAIAGGK